MQTIDLLANGARGSRRRGPGGCRACGRKLWWCATASGKPIPFDEVPEVIVESGDIETVRADQVHWRTCPKADEFRRPRPAGEQPPDPRLPDD